jgi:hypothetical protein
VVKGKPKKTKMMIDDDEGELEKFCDQELLMNHV